MLQPFYPLNVTIEKDHTGGFSLFLFHINKIKTALINKSDTSIYLDNFFAWEMIYEINVTILSFHYEVINENCVGLLSFAIFDQNWVALECNIA